VDRGTHQAGEDEIGPGEEAKMTRTPNIAFDIAREIARQLDGGKSGRRVYAAIRHTFPTATRAELKRAGRIVRERWEMLAEADLEAGKGLTKPTAEALFPEPDKTRS
jgi:hypothetical protein